jgi:hypothetical protein
VPRVAAETEGLDLSSHPNPSNLIRVMPAKGLDVRSPLKPVIGAPKWSGRDEWMSIRRKGLTTSF